MGLSLRSGVSAQKAEKFLRKHGVQFVLPASSATVAKDSARSLRAHSSYLRARTALHPGKMADREEIGGHDREQGGDFYESQEWFIRLRGGKLDRQANIRAALHRDNMPAAQWRGFHPDVPSSTFSPLGPLKSSVPYTQYFSGGPISGRKNGIAYAPSNTNIIYVASAGGGVWKSINAGASFVPLSDNWPFLNTTSVAVHPTNPNVVLVGTGDMYGSFSPNSFGIMRSADGGKTWLNVGDQGMREGTISRLKIEPTNPNIVICTVGQNPNGSTIHRSVDGGLTWAPVATPLGNWTGLDRAIDGTYYATVVSVDASTAGAVYRSSNLGATWVAVTNPADPATPEQAMDIACSKVNASIVYLMLNSENVIYRSANKGVSWTDITGNFPIDATGTPNYNWSQSDYDYVLNCAKDGNTDLLFAGLITVALSRGGGANWVDVGKAYADNPPNNIHSDQHSFAMNPALNNQMLMGCDGGLYQFTLTPGKTTGVWKPLNNTFNDYLVYQFSISPTNANYIQCGCQDNASPASRNNFTSWTGLGGGDGSWTGFQANGQNFVTSQNGDINLYTGLNTFDGNDIKTTSSAFVTGFFAPYIYAEATPKIYGGAKTLWRYTGVGTTWTNLGVSITPTAPAAGDPPNVANTLERAKSDASVVYTGSTLGEVFLVRSNGTLYKRIDNQTLFQGRTIGALDTAWANPYDVIVGLMGASTGTSRIYRCTSTNLTRPVWTSVSGSGITALPDAPVNAIARDPNDANTWYVGTDVGCFMTTNAGASWASMSPLGIPNVLCTSMHVSPAKDFLYVGTFGRGIYKAPLAPATTKFSVTGNLSTDLANLVVGAPVNLYQVKTSTATVSSSPNAGVPDNNANGVSLPLAVTTAATVRNASLSIKVTHPSPQDLEIWLIAPTGVKTLLWSAQTVLPPNLNLALPTTFFNGLSTAGTWKVFVKDTAAGDAGVVNSISLSLQYNSNVLLTSTTSDANGNYTFSGLPAGLYEIIPVNQGKAYTPSNVTFNLGPSGTYDFTRVD